MIGKSEHEGSICECACACVSAPSFSSDSLHSMEGVEFELPVSCPHGSSPLTGDSSSEQDDYGIQSWFMYTY